MRWVLVQNKLGVGTGQQGSRVLPKSEKLPKSESTYLEAAALVSSVPVLSLPPASCMLLDLWLPVQPLGWTGPSTLPTLVASGQLHSLPVAPLSSASPVSVGPCGALSPPSPLAAAPIAEALRVGGLPVGPPGTRSHEVTERAPSSCASDLHSCALLCRT